MHIFIYLIIYLVHATMDWLFSYCIGLFIIVDLIGTYKHTIIYSECIICN